LKLRGRGALTEGSNHKESEGENSDEDDLPAEETATQKGTRFPQEDGD
jgi:hypothetical protein